MTRRGGGTASWRTAARAVVVVVALVGSVVVELSGAAPAGADRRSGARSSVVGRGDIVTSILGWERSTRTGAPRADAPRCRWRTFGDAELEWFVAVTSHLAASGTPVPVPDELRDLLGGGVLPDGDLQARVCDGRIVDVRFAEVVARDPLRILERRMITHLPAPDPTITPPGAATVPVGTPVFVSIDASQWVEVGGTITVDDLTAQVRARPVSLRILPGDPGAPTRTCHGRGRAYDPGDPAPPRRQATRAGACTVTYATATEGRRSTRSSTSGPVGERRPQSWVGTVTVLWQAEWRVGDGEWASLGTIPRTRLIERTVGEVTATVERP